MDANEGEEGESPRRSQAGSKTQQDGEEEGEKEKGEEEESEKGKIITLLA